MLFGTFQDKKTEANIPHNYFTSFKWEYFFDEMKGKFEEYFEFSFRAIKHENYVDQINLFAQIL